MKTVYSSISEIAHIWANKVQSNARNSSDNFYFKNETIYSYGDHFPIARHVKNKNGETAVLFTTRTYSNTTLKHINTVKSAAKHLQIIYCTIIFGTHEENINKFVLEIENIIPLLAKARKKESYIYYISIILNKSKKYSDFFGLDLDERLLNFSNLISNAEIVKYSKELNEKKQKEHEEKLKIELNKFRTFERYRLSALSEYDYLRYNQKNEEIETSQGVKIAKDIAIPFYHWIKNAILKGYSEPKKILHYEVKEVNKKFISIGCHKIKIEEIEAIYKLIS